MQKNTILLIYPPGGYGTFMDWCINWFSGRICEKFLPFAADGSAHKYRGTATTDVSHNPHQNLDWFLRQREEYFLIRTHMFPDDWENKDWQKKLIESYRPNFRKIVMINNDTQYHLLGLHNMFTKIPSLTYQQKINEIQNRYRRQFKAELPIPNWQLREMISFWHIDYRCFLQHFYQPIPDNHGINIGLRGLLHSFEKTLIDLFAALELPMLRVHRLTEIKKRWLSMQSFCNRDEVCQTMVSAVVNDGNFDLSQYDLHIFDEAYIQFLLRVDHDLDLLCHGLNDFPKISREIRSLVIPYVDKANHTVL